MESFKERANPNSHPTQELPSLWMRRHVRERVKAAGAESAGPAPHGPCCPPSPSPRCREALREDLEGAVGGAELPGPQTEQWALAKEEEEWKYSLDQELSQWGHGSVQKLYPRKYERHQEPSHLEDVRYQNLPQWGGENYEKLYRWEYYERHQEPSHLEGVRYRDLSQWEDESVQTLYQWEYETHQEPSQWGNESPQWGSKNLQRRYQRKTETVQQLYQWEDEKYQQLSTWEDEKYQELSQKEFEIYQELSQWEEKRRQELSQWQAKRDEGLSQEDDSDKVLCQWEGSMEQELFEGEFRADPELFHEGDDSDQELSQENWEHIPNRTIWVTPKCPQLLQNPHLAPQRSAQAAASPASWEQVKAAGAESPGPALHSPCCPLSPLPHWLEALRGEWTGTPRRSALSMPQTEQWALAEEENEWKYSLDQELSQCKEEELSQGDPEDDSDKVLCQWEGSTDRELSWCEVRGNPELSQGEVSEDTELSEEGDDRDQELYQENCEYITIHNIWVNPKYPELLQNPPPAPQHSAQAAASPGSIEQVPETGAEIQVPRRHPSRSRRVLRALRQLFRIPCMAGRPED